MAIQILGLRPYTNRDGKERKAEKFFEREWRANSVQELFAGMPDNIANIPEHELWNLYYTASICKEERVQGSKGREFVIQHILPIDIDGIDTNRYEEYVDLVCSELGLSRQTTGIVFSGNGLQFIIGLKKPIEDVSYFDTNRSMYRAMCGKLNQAMYQLGLDGNADVAVFSAARLLRLPYTENRKPKKGNHRAFMINNTIEDTDFDLTKFINVPSVNTEQQIHVDALRRLPEPDTEAVLSGCEFIKHCKANQATIEEPLWYAMLSVVGRLENGSSIVHDYSKEYEGYSQEETDLKIEQALTASGPRRCDGIENLWEGCSACPHYNKITSPIMIRGERHVATKQTGFYNIQIQTNGSEKRTPNYNDLVKHFDNEHAYTTMDIASIVHKHDGKKWIDVSKNVIHNFAEVNFNPSPNNNMCTEFESKLKRTKLKDQAWYQVNGYINFNNGVLRLSDEQLLEHSDEYGFKYVLPFDYDPTATCPRFDKFLEEVTLERQELIDVLVEFMGYSLTGIDPLVGQKALILYGDGSNGKSVFIEVLRALAGEGNYSTLSLGGEINKQENRYQLQGKLFNISEETPTDAMVDSSIFKALVAGGEVQARQLYSNSFSMKNYAKIIMACNELPSSKDMSHGFLRRLLIIPFNARFTKLTKDTKLVDKLIKELAGIFNLALVGAKRFADNSNFTDSEVIENEIEEYISNNDSVQNFVSEECTVSKEAVVQIKELYHHYAMYCEQGRLYPLNKIKFGKRMKQMLTFMYDEDMTIRTGTGRGYRGIKLNGGDY